MSGLFQKIQATPAEVAKPLPGDAIIAQPDASMDRAFTVPGQPKDVWPWLVQLGKNRAGWYFPRSLERFIPRKRRALRSIDHALQHHKVGDVIDDWGGKDGYLEVAMLEPQRAIVYKSTRGKISMSWTLTLWPDGDATRVLIRLRLTSAGKKRLLKVGEIFDKLTILGLANGLYERLDHTRK